MYLPLAKIEGSNPKFVKYLEINVALKIFLVATNTFLRPVHNIIKTNFVL